MRGELPKTCLQITYLKIMRSMLKQSFHQFRKKHITKKVWMTNNPDKGKIWTFSTATLSIVLPGFPVHSFPPLSLLWEKY
jgi:hypothetical protein